MGDRGLASELPALIEGGAPVLRLGEIDSTNAEALRRATAGEVGPLWLLAARQTAGRGRRGRSWLSEPGNLFLTYLGETDRPAPELALLGFAAGVALLEAGQALGARGLSLKWPNDLLLNGRKCAGILLESGASAPGRLWFALGVGVDIASAPEGLDQETAALAEALAEPAPTPEALFAAFAPRLAAWANRLAREGFAPLREAWLQGAHGIGGDITAEHQGARVPGRFEGLSETGELLLAAEPDGRLLRVAAGDVFFPQPNPGAG